MIRISPFLDYRASIDEKIVQKRKFGVSRAKKTIKLNALEANKVFL